MHLVIVLASWIRYPKLKGFASFAKVVWSDFVSLKNGYHCCHDLIIDHCWDWSYSSPHAFTAIHQCIGYRMSPEGPRRFVSQAKMHFFAAMRFVVYTCVAVILGKREAGPQLVPKNAMLGDVLQWPHSCYSCWLLGVTTLEKILSIVNPILRQYESLWINHHQPPSSVIIIHLC